MIKIEQGADKDSLVPISQEDIQETSEQDKKVLGFLTTIPVKEKKLIRIVYKLEKKLRFENRRTSYLFYWQKQPGTKADPLQVEVNFPSSFSLVKIAPFAKASNRQIKFVADNQKDRVFLIEFLK